MNDQPDDTQASIERSAIRPHFAALLPQMHNQSPLHFASERGSEAVVRLLLEHGAVEVINLPGVCTAECVGTGDVAIASCAGCVTRLCLRSSHHQRSGCAGVHDAPGFTQLSAGK